MVDLDVAVIGAGPYGLSAGIHLRAAGLGVCVFGQTMEFWSQKMPNGMLLRSPRVASCISSPNASLSLEAFEREVGEEARAPLPLGTFVAYGRWFHRHLGDDSDPRSVRSIQRVGSAFRLVLQDGHSVTSSNVVVATGIGDFRKLPATIESLGPGHASHCYEGVDIQSLSGKRIAIIGAGQSALECAALLHEAGASVEILARQPNLKWIGKHGWLHAMGPLSGLLYSKHDVGPVGISRLVAYPNLVSHIPLSIRDKIRTRAVRPAGSKWLPDRLSGVKTTTGCVIKEASVVQGEVRLKFENGSERMVDHVLCGTGYKVEISRYSFLSNDVMQGVKTFDGYPQLRTGFETSIPGLHIIGAPAARTFGPLLYFVAGTEFSSRELTRKLRKKRASTASGVQTAVATR